ncbi:T9SS type A sorting domain-containing protein [Flavobacterium sp.]|uniref:T9SS type A sorting domain-containing protein n=1 Tax=Flavobacterium sp. TaxID=239 RepID=UPI0028BECD8A|nr:T9SS type A sorting domain-containing protein [Flavobacterium sp.]
MRNTYLSALLFLFSISMVYGQNENNHWILGKTDLNFSSASPTANVLSSTNYGLASVSDSNGDLLFYTDGIKVWNKNHSIMTNGNNVGYNGVLRVVIVPNPANSNQYFIIRSENYLCLCLQPDPVFYLYSVVEFNASNPLGIVQNINANPSLGTPENSYSVALKEASSSFISNVFYFGPITVTKNSNSDANWLIVQSKNKMLSYKIDAYGFNQTPIESTFSASQIYNYGFFDNYTGTIAQIEGSNFRVAPNNNFLIGLAYSKISGVNDPDSDPATFRNNFYKLDFNAATGQFSNFQLLTGYGGMIYEFEISNNSGNLFFARMKHPYLSTTDGEIIVKDLTNDNTPIRILNEFGTSTPSSKFNYLQKDRQGNLLLSSFFTDNNRNKYLHKIDNQDSFSNSSVNVNFLSLNGNSVSVFPQLIPVLQTCFATLSIAQNVTSGIDKKQASNTITASNVINSGVGAIYHAGNSVTLTSGFQAVSGSTFRAYIEGCTNSFVGRNTNFDFKSEGDLISESNDVKLYPNPNNGVFTLDLGTIKNLDINVYDTLGKLIYHSSNNESIININLNHLPSGLYIAQLNGEGIDKSIKFIKK